MLKKSLHVSHFQLTRRNVVGGTASQTSAAPRRDGLVSVVLALMFLASACWAPVPVFGAQAGDKNILAATPPMGWNDWAHYQCGYTAKTILDNARALVSTGLAARGYNLVAIDDCWMGKNRDANGNLQADPQRFPNGMKPVADAVHKLGLKFGIYEDAGSMTCVGNAGSGQPQGGGQDHFLQDARLFASWGIDLLKLDNCNVYVAPGETEEHAFHVAFTAQHQALENAGRTIMFSECAASVFLGTPDRYTVLSWGKPYGQLFREGTDIANFHAGNPDRPRFNSVLWNYDYNLPLGRFQGPGNWNDPDFILAGDGGMSLAESRSQMALWSMMSAPLILSSDVAKLTPQALDIVGNEAVLAIDQDPLGQMATLVRRTPETDVLSKRLADGDSAIAVLNRSEARVKVDLSPAEFGFAEGSGCTLDAKDLWNGKEQLSASTLQAEVASHDTIIWRIRASSQCGKPSRTGTITLANNLKDRPHSIQGYTRCLTAPGSVGECTGAASQSWTFTPQGALRSGDQCMAVVDGKPVLEACRPVSAQSWRYTLEGNLINNDNLQCLTAAGPESRPQFLGMQGCGHKLAQIWSLPN